MQPELKSLIKRHRRLDIEITRAAGQPAVPSLTIQRLKRLRLALQGPDCRDHGARGRRPA